MCLEKSLWSSSWLLLLYYKLSNSSGGLLISLFLLNLPTFLHLLLGHLHVYGVLLVCGWLVLGEEPVLDSHAMSDEQV